MTPSIWKRIAGFFKKPGVRTTGLVAFLTIKWLLILMIIAGFTVGGVAVGYVASVLKDEPVRSKQEIQEQISENIVTGFVYFHDQTPIGQLRTEEDRRLAELKDIPQQVLDATLSIEDKDFYNHYGFDFNGLFRAAKQKLLNEDVQTGGSTITQQLARRVFLTLDRDITRKFKEIALSVRLERVLSKDEILLAYLNKIPYGNGSNGYTVYGVKAAAKGIFDKDDLNQLNVAQSAYLAGLPQMPSNYSAFSGKGEFDSEGFKRAVKRQQLVLKRMLEESKITQVQYEEALAFDLRGSLAKPSQKAYTTYPYLMLEVERRAAEALVRLQYPDLLLDTPSQKEAYNEAIKDAHSRLLRSGYHVYTTIDKTIYDSMQDIAKNPKNFTADLPNKGKDGLEQIGAMMIDNKSGAILGMMEGRDFYTEQLNHATQMYRQPGSTMKPIAAYIPAMEKGAIQPASVIDDVPLILPDGQKGVHLPENWNGQFQGLVTARTALNQSYNIPAIKLFLYQVGIKEAWDFAAKMGITSITKEDQAAQTGVIGGLSKGVSVEEMTNAYTTIPAQGVFNDAFMIEKIVDSKGKVIYQHETKPTRVYSEQTAYLMTDMLRTVVTSGTAADVVPSKFKYLKKVAASGKTGSTQDDADAWFMGFTPDITVGVWAGYDQPVNKLLKPSGTKRALNVWAQIMNEAYEKKPDLFPNKAFPKPDGIVQMSVSSVSGKLPNELTTAAGRVTTDLFNKKYVPTEEDDVMVKMKTISYDGVNYIPQPSTPDDFLEEKIVIRREKSIGKILEEIKAAQTKIPEDKRKPIEHYTPKDAADDAPSLTDPRSDDGYQPSAPENLSVTQTGNGYRISFDTVSAPDIVGYRLYRSMDGGPYSKVASKILSTGQEAVFEDDPDQALRVGYYVTAVDVAGRESNPGKAAFGDGLFRELTEPSSPMASSSPAGGSGTGGAGGTGGAAASASPGGSAKPTPKPSADSAPDGAPAAPTGLRSSAKGLSVQLSWNPSPSNEGVKLYTIYIASSENGEYKQLGVSNRPEFIYYASSGDDWYRISASNAKGEGPLSKPLHVKRQNP